MNKRIALNVALITVGILCTFLLSWGCYGLLGGRVACPAWLRYLLIESISATSVCSGLIGLTAVFTVLLKNRSGVKNKSAEAGNQKEKEEEAAERKSRNIIPLAAILLSLFLFVLGNTVSLIMYATAPVGSVWWLHLLKPVLTACYCSGLIGFTAALASLLKNRSKRLADCFLIVLAVLGPFPFFFTFHCALRGPEYLTAFCGVGAGLLGAAAVLMFLADHRKTFKSGAARLGLLPLSVLLLANLYCFFPVHQFFWRHFNINIFDWIRYYCCG